MGRAGYAFVDVRSKIEPRPGRTAVSTLPSKSSEGPRVFVERIDIRGNLRTEDRVIRREFRLVEGDAFNTDHIRRARRNLRNLGFFEEVEIKHLPGSAPDQTLIEANVKERATGEIGFGAGYSTSVGGLAEVTLRERNLDRQRAGLAAARASSPNGSNRSS